MQIGNIPLIFSIVPSNESSPTKILSLKSSFTYFTFSEASKIPTAIGKSKEEPSFLIFAGDKFTTIFLLKNSIPAFFIAIFTLSFASFILVPGKPTISKVGIPLEISTWIDIKWPFKPSKVILFTFDNKLSAVLST